jgi:class 3 adenylate cyclase
VIDGCPPTGAVGQEPSLTPYVPGIVIDWLRAAPGRRHRRIDSSLVFADISGFTALTEKLARRGKVGAEELWNLLDQVFDPLLARVYDHGADLLKWGGDAVLLLFDGEHHSTAAGHAAVQMQHTIRQVGRLATTADGPRCGCRSACTAVRSTCTSSAPVTANSSSPGQPPLP